MAEQTKIIMSEKLAAIVVQHWQEKKSCTISMQKQCGKIATGLYCTVAPGKAVWRYDRYGFKGSLGTFIFALPGGSAFSIITYEDAIKLKTLLDNKLLTADEDTQRIIQSQALVIAGLRAEKEQTQKLMKEMQKRLEALEARSIERDLGADA